MTEVAVSLCGLLHCFIVNKLQHVLLKEGRCSAGIQARLEQHSFWVDSGAGPLMPGTFTTYLLLAGTGWDQVLAR